MTKETYLGLRIGIVLIRIRLFICKMIRILASDVNIFFCIVRRFTTIQMTTRDDEIVELQIVLYFMNNQSCTGMSIL